MTVRIIVSWITRNTNAIIPRERRHQSQRRTRKTKEGRTKKHRTNQRKTDNRKKSNSTQSEEKQAKREKTIKKERTKNKRNRTKRRKKRNAAKQSSAAQHSRAQRHAVQRSLAEGNKKERIGSVNGRAQRPPESSTKASFASGTVEHILPRPRSKVHLHLKKPVSGPGHESLRVLVAMSVRRKDRKEELGGRRQLALVSKALDNVDEATVAGALGELDTLDDLGVTGIQTPVHMGQTTITYVEAVS